MPNMTDWRTIEANLVLICRQQGNKIVDRDGVPRLADRDGYGLLNLEMLARDLAERGEKVT